MTRCFNPKRSSDRPQAMRTQQRARRRTFGIARGVSIHCPTALVLLVVNLAAGCAASPRNNGMLPAASEARRAALRERSLERFDAAVMYKPREDLAGQELLQLAPLIVYQVPEEADAALLPAPFGAVFIDDDWGVWIDVTQPTVYSTRLRTRIAGTEYEQIAFVWWSRDPRHNWSSSDRCAYGFRMTLGADGFPLVWEVADCTQRFDVLYASASLEAAAQEWFGGPADGARFAVERPAAEAPASVVVRVLDDGPMPMGPYVYISDADGAVTTLLCRCMASQVESFVGTAYYEIRPLEELGDPESLRRAGAPVWSDVPLDERLRWPFDKRSP